MRIALSLVVFISSVNAFAVAPQGPSEGKITDACNVCTKLDHARLEVERGTRGAIEKTNAILDRTFLSKNKALRTREIASMLKLGAVIIPKDDSDRSAEDIYDSYRDYVPEFKAAIDRMSPTDARTIQKAMDNVKSVIDNGNG